MIIGYYVYNLMYSCKEKEGVPVAWCQSENVVRELRESWKVCGYLDSDTKKKDSNILFMKRDRSAHQASFHLLDTFGNSYYWQYNENCNSRVIVNIV